MARPGLNELLQRPIQGPRHQLIWPRAPPCRLQIKRGIFRLQGKVDPESIFEENAQRAGLEIVYLASHDIGVEKVLEKASKKG